MVKTSLGHTGKKTHKTSHWSFQCWICFIASNINVLMIVVTMTGNWWH